MQDRRFKTLEEDQRRPMVLQTASEAKAAREAMVRPKTRVRRIEVKRGDATFTVYPGVGTAFIEMGDARVTLVPEQVRVLQSLLNEQLPINEKTTKDEE